MGRFTEIGSILTFWQALDAKNLNGSATTIICRTWRVFQLGSKILSGQVWRCFAPLRSSQAVCSVFRQPSGPGETFGAKGSCGPSGLQDPQNEW